MLKRNSGITDTKLKPDDTADEKSTKIQLLFCIRCRGDNTQASANGKIQCWITKSEYKSVWLGLCFDYKSNNFGFVLDLNNKSRFSSNNPSFSFIFHYQKTQIPLVLQNLKRIKP